jgi:hypothetical protein
LYFFKTVASGGTETFRVGVDDVTLTMGSSGGGGDDGGGGGDDGGGGGDDGGGGGDDGGGGTGGGGGGAVGKGVFSAVATDISLLHSDSCCTISIVAH